VIDSKNPKSHNHLALHVSYPDATDRMLALRRVARRRYHDSRLAQRPRPAGRFASRNHWTDGCIAVTNSQIEEIWSLVKVGPPIETKP
jgi:murein L,D-transpeptidase YafK